MNDALNPGYFNEQAQQDPLWIAWAQPSRIAAQIDLLFAESLPMASPEGDPRPDAERFSHDMVGWVCEQFDDLFPDWEALTEPDNADLADQFVCYFGEALRALAGGEWFNEDYETAPGSVLYDEKFTPAIGYRWGNSPDDITSLLFDAVEADGGTDAFVSIGSEIYSRSVDYAHERGVPHEIDEERRKAGLV
ncbi:hypothetical protein D7D52_27600 [Nocardia yunnanensis]|uniref:Uncharacterized protein n=1 Tax=Nocardia yunnanensis TaxID=2382165 RepID=A0A386ZHF0_9NOCA|nr:hypothetical protein [Nocardia yunnanensis]AYF76941.1 hypothetical protein D7D52_27600 [Nocardia yunnanensis]